MAFNDETFTYTADPGFTLYCYFNSAAHMYAAQNSIKYVLLDVKIGDADGDGGVDTSDARLALRAAVGLEVLTEKQAFAADADSDGEITLIDARIILRCVLGLQSF